MHTTQLLSDVQLVAFASLAVVALREWRRRRGTALFDPFTRGADTGGISGSGLGLAITQRLVENFGGRIGYEPGTPRGARFSLHLRRAA